MSATADHKHEFPVQPPRGSWVNPGPCTCGLTWERSQAERDLREAQERLAAMDAEVPGA